MKRATNVLMTADAVGGVWTYALDLARGLGQRDVDVTLAVLGPSPSLEQRAAAEAVSGLRLVETGLPLDWTAESRADIAEAGQELAALAAGFDLVHLNSPALAAYGPFPCPIVAVCHSCLATWWAAVRGGALPADFSWRTDLMRAGYETADLLVAPSFAFGRATADTYGLTEAPRTVHNGRAPRRPVAANGGFATPFILTAGRLWDEGKNVRLLERVAARVPATILAAGPTRGPNGAEVALHHATALGHVDEAKLDGLFAAHPIFASLALYEPFGLAVLEAAQAGCPLVLSDIPTFRELWESAAVFVDPGDEVGVTRALCDLINDAPARARLGRAAQDRAGHYTVDRMVDGVMSAYRDVLARGPLSLVSAA